MAARAWVSWISGKDSAAALDAARHDPALDVVGLMVTMNGDADRVAMHAVRRHLVELQAERLGVALHVVEIPSTCPNEIYEQRMAGAMAAASAQGVEAVVFGDLFLRDVRSYRERALAGTGIRPVFPLWGHRTDELAPRMIADGIRAVLTCVDPSRLEDSFAGRPFDAQLLGDLPAGVDPCGENGEFHTFVWDAPGFAEPIAIETGPIVSRDGFVFCDVLPAGGASRGSNPPGGAGAAVAGAG